MSYGQELFLDDDVQTS